MGVGRHISEIIFDQKDFDPCALWIAYHDLDETATRHAIHSRMLFAFELLAKVNDTNVW